uniref:Uncharacterized protein n=1 Tax=Romanomermis culicivorax TaxID=13658 RepID=A0A915L9R1_ROMCU
MTIITITNIRDIMLLSKVYPKTNSPFIFKCASESKKTNHTPTFSFLQDVVPTVIAYLKKWTIYSKMSKFNTSCSPPFSSSSYKKNKSSNSK